MSKSLLSFANTVRGFILNSLQTEDERLSASSGPILRTFVVHSEAGYGHRNEDAVLTQKHPGDSSRLICTLADGQGGQAGGAVASRTAVEKCMELALSKSAGELRTPSTWYQILSYTDESVREYPDAGFTTLIGLCVKDEEVCGASCGDSAVMLVTHNGFALLTEKQRKNPPVGSKSAFPVAFSAKIKEGDKLLIMSDGVWRFIGYDVIAQASRKEKGQDLVAAIRRLQTDQSGGKLQDDFSLIIVE